MFQRRRVRSPAVRRAIALGLGWLALSCAPRQGALLVELGEIAPRTVEVGDRLRITGFGLSPGAPRDGGIAGRNIGVRVNPSPTAIEVRTPARLVSPPRPGSSGHARAGGSNLRSRQSASHHAARRSGGAVRLAARTADHRQRPARRGDAPCDAGAAFGTRNRALAPGRPAIRDISGAEVAHRRRGSWWNACGAEPGKPRRARCG